MTADVCPLRRTGWAVPLGWAALYVAVIALGRLAVLPETGLALFWPAAGVAALWLLRGTTRREVLLDGALLAAVTGLYFAPAGPLAAVLLAGANLAQAAAVRLVLARATRRPVLGDLGPSLGRPRDLLRLATAAGAAAVVGSLLGTPASWALTGDLTWSTAPAWVVRNACGTYVVAATVLALREARRERRGESLALTAEPRRRAGAELALAVLATAALGGLVFGADAQLPVTYLVLATSAWIGNRFAPWVGALHSLGFGTAAVVVTLLGWGPFAVLTDPTTRAVALQVFVAVTTSLVLLLALGVGERAALTHRLRRSESRATSRAALLDAVTEAMSDGLCVSDSRGRVVLANSAAAELGGADASGRHVHDPADVEHSRIDGRPALPDGLPHARALRGESVAPTDVVRVDPDTGAERVLSVSAVPLDHDTVVEVTDPQDAAGAADPTSATDPAPGPLAVVLLRDVTRERADSRVLASFAGVVAHDLKNPLTAVLSWSEVARDALEDGGGDPAAACAHLDRLDGAARRMERLIDDLLAYTLAGSAELHRTGLDLDEVLADVVRDLGVGDRGAVVEHRDLGRVRADELLTRQLFANLVGNAVKYVAPGVRPHVQITSRVVDDRLEVRVTDNGLGIERADRARVFESFFRSAATGGYPGTGLGLAICQRAVARHGGRISALEGPGGVGTTFVLTLPLDGPTGVVGAAPAADTVAIAAALPLEDPGEGAGPFASSPLGPSD
ncbi:ATP-binding protein [Nocardioides aurantiacus]|uniref:Sensor-like histidine kinase SenX3 n=1 Tax=Nocardioides aurantiacus TaxID=86796 RepID=A0A3N2CRF4_9ACTN|nr:ATP-binding protein [Nocardioides aurantiacus]ROR90113.1 PAS domain-containing protein [Nocardioides aurantiacus]